MKFTIASPSKAYVEASPEEMEMLTKMLSYTNTSAQHMVKRHYNNRTWRGNSPDAWAARLEELKKDVNKTVIFNDENGTYIRPGSISRLNVPYELVNLVKYPEVKKAPWSKVLPFELYPYQDESWVSLLKECINGWPANVELCTGAGKSAILLKICRESGLRTAVIAPSQSVFNELVEKFEFHLGKGNIGKFGDGKKVLGKRFTICIGDSISNIKPGTKEWAFFSTLDMICVDESHTWGADSLENICHGVLADVPYRTFFSGTQTRGDGSERLLHSIIGKTVCTLSTAEAKEKGYIANHEFRIVELESSNPNQMSSDALAMKRIHFLNNKNIAAFIAKVVNAEATISGKQTLVLVEELLQIAMLMKLLKVPFAYAHSEKRALRLEELGLEKVDTAESVEKFNKNEVKVLIGTSCISTGTNIFPVHHAFNWVGGTSEIKTKQGAVGRSIRLHGANPHKDKCVYKDKAIIWDFLVSDIYLMAKHLEDRTAYYKDSNSSIQIIKLKK